MKGDFTRFSHDQRKHYTRVLKQQGRVDLDADWNEAVEIFTHLRRTTTQDVVGQCGVPHETPEGWQIKLSGGNLTVTPGRIVVDGVLCTLEGSAPNPNAPVDIHAQPDLPNYGAPDKDGVYIAYADVWERHMTYLEDPDIRENALGGPDTATRTRTLGQIKLHRLGGDQPLDQIECQPFPGFKSTGWLSAKTEPAEKPSNPCVMPAAAGYRGLENRLYRVEIHTDGRDEDGNPVGTPTFKWSRDNGAVLLPIAENGIDGKTVTLKRLGHDEVLTIQEGDWVEILGDETELKGQPGTLAQIVPEGINKTQLKVTLSISVSAHAGEQNLKMRRWDHHATDKVSLQDGALPAQKDWFELEDGVQVKFDTAATYQVGDYWVIPARTREGTIIWPQEGHPPAPAKLPRLGIHHHYCPLALVRRSGGTWMDVKDCRPLFPPLTRLTTLLYESGDGQEAMPGETLPQPLRVRVVNGQIPVIDAKVKFAVELGGGVLSVSNPVESKGPHGMAECTWTLGQGGKQRVNAFLLDRYGQPVNGQVLHFNAGLSVASDVYYNPKNCSALANATTVQDAIDLLCKMERGTGCAVTVGHGGQYASLEEAFADLKESPELNICLMPGEHVIEKDLVVEDKQSIKITGFGSGGIVRQLGQRLMLEAQSVLIQDVGLEAENKTGFVSLAGADITLERCALCRRVGSDESGPLVLVRASKKSSKATLHCRSNHIVAKWTAEMPDKAKTFLVPAAEVELPAAATKRLGDLLARNPQKDPEGFAKALELVMADVKQVARDRRSVWFSKRPVNQIEALPAEQRAAVEGFYTQLNASRLNTAAVAKAFEDVAKAFYVLYYEDALALEKGVGGWIEDTVFDGYVSLHYDNAFESLRWVRTGEEEQKNKASFADKTSYIQVDPLSLSLRGNDFYQLRSNGFSIMKAIGSILKSGEWSEEAPELGYRSMSVSDNTFHANNNSFVGQSIIMKGNEFTGAGGEEDVAANVLGYSGIFAANLCGNRRAAIETILRPGRVESAANILVVL